MDGVGNDLVILDKSDWGAAGGNHATQALNSKSECKNGQIQKISSLRTANYKTHENRKPNSNSILSPPRSKHNPAFSLKVKRSCDPVHHLQRHVK